MNISKDIIYYDYKCIVCYKCIEICPSGSLQLIGKEISADQLIREIEKDVIYFDSSFGGVTFSGGEPFMKPSFLKEILIKCKNKDIHTTIDTSGYVKPDIFYGFINKVDLFLYDLKLLDDKKHKIYNGVSNILIKYNLKKNRLIKKRYYTKIFRHSRATHMANHLTEAQMCQYFGWVQGSNMPRAYVHLSGRDLDGPILEMYGIKKEKKKKYDFGPKKCSRCEKMNSSAERICSRCGSPLDVDAAMKLEKEQEQANLKMKAIIKYLLMNTETRKSTIEIMNQVNYEYSEDNCSNENLI